MQGSTVVASPTSAGSYSVTATLNNPNYTATPATGTLVIGAATNKATIILGNLNQTYSGSPEYVTATTTPAGLAVTVVYMQGNTVVINPTNAGSYSVTATLKNSNYTATPATGTLVIAKAAPSFSNLAAPTIVYNTLIVTLGGTINGFATANPTGTVTITAYYGGKQEASQIAKINANGTFSSTLLSVFAKVGQHTLVYSYSGDGNYEPSSSTVVATVTYGVNALFSQTIPTKAGGTVAVKLALIDAFGLNVGSSSETATVVGIAPGSNPGAVTSLPAGNAATFGFSQGIYTLNLKTTGLTAGSYILYFLVAGDPVMHSVQFILN
jgi:hypothetical protein